MKEINNIADTTDRATYQSSPTKISPAMEQLYFEMEDKEHVFQIGLKTILECILFGAKEKQLPDLPLSWYTEVCSRYDIPMSELFGEGENTESESLVSISKLSYTCMLNRICHLPFTVEEMEKYRTAGLGQLLLLILRMETYKEYDGHKLRPVLSEMHLIREKNEQLYENIKIVFREDFDDNGFLKKDTRNEVYTLLCEKTDISEISITIFLDRLNAGKDL